MREEKQTEYWTIQHARLYTGRDHISGAFVSNDWETTVLVGELPDASRRNCEALVVVGKEYGSHHIAGMNRTMIDNASIYVDEVSCEGFGRVAANMYDPTDAHIFSDSNDWALVYNPPDSLYVLGASKSFMNAFLTLAGGRERLRAEFASYVQAWKATERTRQYTAALGSLGGWADY